MKRRGNGEGHISKLANGKYFAQISVGGDRPTRTFKTQKEAQVWMTEIKDAANNGRYINPSLKPLSVYWDKWITVDKAKSVSAVTLQTYKHSRARLPDTLFKMSISRITRSDIQAALNGINGKRRTVEMTRTALNMCFNQAVEDKLIRESPVHKTVLPPKERRMKKAYSHESEDALIEYCLSSPRLTHKGEPWQVDINAQVYKDMLLTILRTGMRRAEACSLIWSDWADSKILVRGTKNDASVGTVPLTPDIIEILKRRHKTAKSIYIFETSHGKPVLGNSLYHFVKKKFNNSVHGLRHTLARDAMEAGINPRIVQEILRHTDIRTTLEIYTDISEDDKAAAIIKIAGMEGKQEKGQFVVNDTSNST